MADDQKEPVELDRLTEAERYSYFIQTAADEATLWSLWQDGWASLSDEAGREGLPVWPAATLAESWRSSHFPETEAMPIDVNWFVDEMLPNIGAEGGYVIVFPTAVGAVWAKPDRLEADLRSEMNLLG
jgi:hypothetical protein